MDVAPIHRTAPALIALCVAAALSVAGCGGGEDETAEPLTEEAFLEAATAACEEATLSLGEAAGFEGVADESQFIEFWQEERQPVLDQLESEIGDLDAPDELAAAQADYVDALGESNDLSREDPIVVIAAAIDPDATTAERYAELDGAISARAADLGLPEDCGELSLPR